MGSGGTRWSKTGAQDHCEEHVLFEPVERKKDRSVSSQNHLRSGGGSRPSNEEAVGGVKTGGAAAATISSFRAPIGQCGFRRLGLHLGGITSFGCPPLGPGVPAVTGTRDPTITTTSSCGDGRGGEHGPLGQQTFPSDISTALFLTTRCGQVRLRPSLHLRVPDTWTEVQTKLAGHKIILWSTK